MCLAIERSGAVLKRRGISLTLATAVFAASPAAGQLTSQAAPTLEGRSRSAGQTYVPSLADLELVLDSLAVTARDRAHAATYDAAMSRAARPGIRYPSDVDRAVAQATAILASGDPVGAPDRASIERATSDVRDAIISAAHATGISFEFLWRTAQKESDLNPLAAADGSSARGLYQFVERTWLGLLARHGRRHGVELSEARERAQALNLRFSPWLAARMAGELASENREAMERALGRRVDDTDLYVAHFLGSADAVRLIRAASQRPHADAAQILPEAARANIPVFFDRGRALSSRRLLERLRHG